MMIEKVVDQGNKSLKDLAPKDGSIIRVRIKDTQMVVNIYRHGETTVVSIPPPPEFYGRVSQYPSNPTDESDKT
jgi:hypothetical protein